MTQNLYCSGCLRTQTFVSTERGYKCPACRKELAVADRPACITPIRQRDLPQRERVGGAA